MSAIEILAKNLFFIDRLFEYAKAPQIKITAVKVESFKAKIITNCGWNESDFPEEIKRKYYRQAEKELGVL